MSNLFWKKDGTKPWGIPSESDPEDASYLESALSNAKEFLAGEKISVVMLEPVLRRLQLPGRSGEGPAILPPVCTIAEFNSAKPARDEREVFSSIAAIWFGDRFGLPDDEDTLQKLRALDWTSKALDWTP